MNDKDDYEIVDKGYNKLRVGDTFYTLKKGEKYLRDQDGLFTTDLREAIIHYTLTASESFRGSLVYSLYGQLKSVEGIMTEGNRLNKNSVRETKDVEIKPINMILFCPACHKQHIDKIEFAVADSSKFYPIWNNPPHKSHLCSFCGNVWRPCDLPTNGVEKINTCGKNDIMNFSINSSSGKNNG